MHRLYLTVIHSNLLKFRPCHGQRIGPAVYTLTRPPCHARLRVFSLKCFPSLCSLSVASFSRLSTSSHVVTVVQMSIPFLLVPLDSAPYFSALILGVLTFATVRTELLRNDGSRTHDTGRRAALSLPTEIHSGYLGRCQAENAGVDPAPVSSQRLPPATARHLWDIAPPLSRILREFSINGLGFTENHVSRQDWPAVFTILFRPACALSRLLWMITWRWGRRIVCSLPLLPGSWIRTSIFWLHALASVLRPYT